MLQLIFALVIAFFLGFPFGFFIAQAKNVDIQKEGSGNPGVSNIWRTFGAPWGVFVLFMDVGKACFVVTVLYNIIAVPAVAYIAPWFGAYAYEWLYIFLGSAVILGNIFAPELFGKRGGKAVATSVGVMLGIHPGILLIGLAVFGITLSIFRMVSIASIIGAISVLICAFSFVYGYTPMSYFTLGVVIMIIIRHIPNLEKIKRGTENKI